MDKLYHLVSNNINIKDQFNDAISYDPKFEDKFSLSRDLIRYPLPVLTVALIGRKINIRI